MEHSTAQHNSSNIHWQAEKRRLVNSKLGADFGPQHFNYFHFLKDRRKMK